MAERESSGQRAGFNSHRLESECRTVSALSDASGLLKPLDGLPGAVLCSSYGQLLARGAVRTVADTQGWSYSAAATQHAETQHMRQYKGLVSKAIHARPSMHAQRIPSISRAHRLPEHSPLEISRMVISH